MDLKKIKRGAVLCLFLVFLLPACEQPRSAKTYPLHYSDAIMGTSFTVKVSSLPETLLKEELKILIKRRLDSINEQMSTYDKDSELSLINSNQSKLAIDVSDDLYAVLKQARNIFELSEGTFDITVGPLVNLWGFGPDAISLKAPDSKIIDQQLKRVGFEKLVFDDDNQQIQKQIPALYLDLSAIAKGYAVDQVGLLLEQQGIINYMVEIGGEIRLKGKNISNQSWRIAVEKPTAKQRMIQKVLPLTDISIATSGDYRNFFEVDGSRFSHTIDPRTGKPIKHKLASITILSDTTMKADAWATALMVLGPAQGFKVAEEQKIAALFIIKSEGGFVEKASTEFLKRLR